MEASKKKKKSKKRPAKEDCEASSQLLADDTHSLQYEADVAVNIDESADMTISEPHISPVTADISLHTVGQVTEMNQETIQETALTEIASALPTAPTLDDLPRGDISSSTGAEPVPKIQFVTKNVNCGYKPLSEISLLRLYLAETLIIADTNLEKTANLVIEDPQYHFNVSLEKFLQIHKIIEGYLITLESKQVDLNILLEKVWEIELKTLSETGECQDGNPVSTELVYGIHHFNKTNFDAFAQCLGEIKEVCHQNITHSLYSAELLRQHVAQFIDELSKKCLMDIVVTNSVQLLTNLEHHNVRNQVLELRTCVALLFKFYKKKVTCHKSYYENVKLWLIKLVEVLLKVGTSVDHIFLLRQVLSVPGKIPKWMKQFIQIPRDNRRRQSPLQSPYLAHTINVLAELMRSNTINSTNEENLDPVCVLEEQDSSWVLIDSDGEDDVTKSHEMNANDIFDIFNQLSWEDTFCWILHIKKDENKRYVLDGSYYDDHYMIEIIAFMTAVIKEIRIGLQTYSRPHYNRFARRLGQLIKNIAQHVTDVYDIYTQEQGDNKLPNWPLQWEYDMFIKRCVNTIYSCQAEGMWLFLATLPFYKVSTATLWHLYSLLHVDYNESLDVDFPSDLQEWEQFIDQGPIPSQFEDCLILQRESESLYLLTSFSSLALANKNLDGSSWTFIRTVTLDLFQVGFMSALTQDRFSKHVKAILGSMTDEWPLLISDILKKMPSFNFLETENSSLDLFRDLALFKWIPDLQDIEIIKRWLLEKPTLSTEFSLARLILANLNYGYNEDPLRFDNLFLGYSVQCKIGVIVVETMLKTLPDQLPSAALSTTGLIGDMVCKYVAPATNLTVLTKWGWKILTQLRIHNMEQGHSIAAQTLYNPEIYLQKVPDLYEHQDLKMVATGVLQSHPAACYLAIMMTTIGHSVPLICSKGFALVNLLVKYQFYREALKCISILVPMFLRCPESLIQCDMFRTVIVGIYGADKSFLRLGNPFSSNQAVPGFYLKHLGALVNVHLINASSSYYGPGALEDMVSLWLKCLVKLPDWINDASTLYVIDVLLRYAFGNQNSFTTAHHILLDLYMLPSMEKEMKNQPLQTNNHDSNSTQLNKPESTTVEMFLQFKKQCIHPPLQSLMSKVSLPNNVWFAMTVIYIEKTWQEETQFWGKILTKLYEQKGNVNIDQAVGNALLETGLSISLSPGSLPIYRLVYQALDTPVDHPALLLLWQWFFVAYLARVPAEPFGSKGGVGHKFFDGSIGEKLVKEIKKRLLETAAYYSSTESLLRDDAQKNPSSLRELESEITRYSQKARLLKTYHLWFEDHGLMESNLLLSNLEPMYDIPKLQQTLFNGNQCLYDFGPEEDFQKGNKLALNDWEKLLYRYEDITKIPWLSAEKRTVPVMEKTYRILSCYDTPFKFEEVLDTAPFTIAIPPQILQYKDNLTAYVKDQLEILLTNSQLQMHNLAEHTAMDCAVLEHLPSLYSSTQVEKTLTAECHSSPPHQGVYYYGRSTCAGPAEIRVIITETVINQSSEAAIAEARSTCSDVIRRALKPARSDCCLVMNCLEKLVEDIVGEYHVACINSNHQRQVVLKELAVACFFTIVANYTQPLDHFAPTDELIVKMLTCLAEPFLKNGFYVEQLLTVVLEKPRLVPILNNYIALLETTPSTFLRLYSLVSRKAYESPPDENTFSTLLLTFSVEEWLKKHQASSDECTILLDEIFTALKTAGLQPDTRNYKVYQIIREHLIMLLQYNFPDNFKCVLSHMLKASTLQHISVDVWYDFINALIAKERLSMSDSIRTVTETINKFALKQQLFPVFKLQETMGLLSTYFTYERNLYGLYGLYPKYSAYVEPIMVFQLLIYNSFIVATLGQESTAFSSAVCEKVWPALEELYLPWIAPLQTEHLQEPPAAWFDQLAEDRSILLPWIPPDVNYASKSMQMFIESIRFVLEIVSGEILSYLWQYYVAKFVHRSITENILFVVQNHMATLPWQQFKPSLTDMDVMFKVITQSVPGEVYCFLGTIFTKVAWVPWLSNIMHQYKENSEVLTKIHVCMLHLYVRLAKDNDVRKVYKITEMLSSAKKFDWHLVDPTAFGLVIDWWVYQYNPKVAAGLQEPYVNPIDVYVMNLLEVAGGFSTEVLCAHPTTAQKRVLFVRGKLKMLQKISNSDRNFVEKNVNDVSLSLHTLLTTIENIVQRTVQEECRLEECSLLVKEVVILFNEPDSNELKKVALKVISAWLTRENNMSVVVQGFLRVTPTDVTNLTTMGQLLEICLNSYFKHTVMQVSPPSWSTAVELMSTPTVPNIEDALVSNGYLLALHALLYKQILVTKSVREEVTLLTKLVDWICMLKTVQTEESKLPLVWGVAVLLIHRQCQLSENIASVTRSIRRLITHFLDLSEEKSQIWNILGTFGLRKQICLTTKGRLLSRAMAVFLLAQLPEGDAQHLNIRLESNTPGAIVLSPNSSERIGPVPTCDAVRALNDLEALASNKSFAELKDTINLSVKLIKDPTQCIMTVRQFFGKLSTELFSEQYLYVLTT